MVKFDIPVYGGSVALYRTREEFRKACEETPDEETPDLEGCHGITQPITDHKDQFSFRIGIFDNNLSTLIHECCHVAIFICGHTNWQINEETSEPFCYLLEEIFRLSHPILEG